MKIKLSDIKAYIVGNIRHYLYHNNKLKWFIRNHIYFQIQARVNSMDKQCYNDGSCKECGCTTIALQMANKACDGKCYPEMVSRKRWNLLSSSLNIHFTDNNGDLWRLENNKFIKI